MKSIIRPLGISVLLGCATAAWAQDMGFKVDRVDIKFIGPEAVSEDYVRANIKLKAGVTYLPNLTQDDVHSLYGTGQFYNITVSVDRADDDGVIVTYKVQSRPRISEVRLEGNNKLTDHKLKKLITVKVGEPLDEQKLFTDVQAIKKQYEKYGLSDTQVKYVLNIDSATGHGVVVFQVVEAPKVKITEVDFFGTSAFKQKQLRKEIKTRRRWMFSWLTGSGYFIQDDFDSDRDALTEFYRSHGYLDFEIKDIKLVHPTPSTLIIKYYLYEGRQYRVGSVKITGNKIYSDAEIVKGLTFIHDYQHLPGKLGPNGLPMDVGDVFKPDGMTKDITAVEDFYGSKGYIDVSQGQALRVVRVPNVEGGTMDMEFQVGNSQKAYVQKIEIRGNLKTKDKVIRRELAISPGEVFDMVRVKISQSRLEGLQYFSKVEMDPEPTDPPIPGRKNLVVNVEEESTGNFTVGAGFSSVESLFGYVTVGQSNFDPFKPPYFTGGGDKIKLTVQVGLKEQEYDLNYLHPWFLDRKLTLGSDLYRHQLYYESPNDVYDETRTGVRLSLTRTLFNSDFIIGSTYYNLEQVGIGLNSGWYGEQQAQATPSGDDLGAGKNSAPTTTGAATSIPANVPPSILEQTGVHLFQRVGGSLGYDTRNSVQLPNHGQHTTLTGEFSDELTSGNDNYYKLELTTAWFFPGFFKGNVIEVGGRVGVEDSLGSADVPFYDRYYLGGVYSLRGFKYRNVSPREVATSSTAGGTTVYNGVAYYNEPIGGDNYWFGSIEYSFPIFEKDGGVSLRFALFYDIGAVGSSPYSFNTSFDDNWGAGIRLNIPHLGPLRLDYGIPISHDQFNSSSGQFQFSVGFERPF
jgi:outer membrane protein insertion porin family